MFTARYALSPYIKQIRFVFKGFVDYSVSLLFIPSHLLPITTLYLQKLYLLVGLARNYLMTEPGFIYMESFYVASGSSALKDCTNRITFVSWIQNKFTALLTSSVLKYVRYISLIYQTDVML